MIFARRSRTKSISTTHKTTKQISSRHWTQYNFHSPYRNQDNFNHPHKNQVNFHGHPENMWLLANIKVISHLLRPIQQPNQFHPYTDIISSSIPHIEIMLISTITETKSNSMLTLETRNFRPAHKNKVEFETRTKHNSIPIPTLKSSQSRSPLQ